MTIGFKDREVLIERVINDVTDREFGCSWNLGIPPCFEAEETLDIVVHKLQHEPCVAVADITSDTVPDHVAYIHSLHRQWSACVDLPSLTSGSPDAIFDYLIASLPEKYLFVQVVRQFHKILDCLDVWFLGKMRDAEQRGKLRTVTATPLSLPDLKKRWDKKHVCTVSGYGDTHSHRYVEPHDLSTLIDFAKTLDVSPGLAGYLYAQSGGYPKCFLELIRNLRRSKANSLTLDTKRSLRNVAVGCLGRFVKLMDDESQTSYRDAVVDLYHGVEKEDALEKCRTHPWGNILLDKSGELRAECLGVAAVTDMTRDGVLDDSYEDTVQMRIQRAFDSYRHKHFADAANLLDQIPVQRPEFKITRANASVMGRLYGDGTVGEDTDWKGVARAANDALATLKCHELLPNDSSYLSDRLQWIYEFTMKIVALQKGNEKRVVDALAGMFPAIDRDEQSAALLMLLKSESCKAMSGHAAACQSALFLPEQLLRVWAFWQLGVSYYSTPDDAESTWAVVESEWPSQFGSLRRSDPGKQFPSLLSFGYFVLARANLGGDNNICFPVDDYSELQKVFSRYEQLRNPKSHSYCITTRKEREQFFELVDRWLDCVIASSRAIHSRNELLGAIEPLPLVTRQGELVYS